MVEFHSGAKHKIVKMIRSTNNRIISKNGIPSCSCCTIPDVYFTVSYASTYCSNICGDQSILRDGETYSIISESEEDAPCPYTTTNSIQDADGSLLVGDSCAFYQYVRSQDDYTVVRQEKPFGSGNCISPFPEKVEDYIELYKSTATGVDPNTGVVSIQCTKDIVDISGTGGYPGQRRNVFKGYSQKITNCPVIYTSFSDPATAITVSFSYLKSRSGNMVIADKAKYSISQEQLAQVPSGLSVKIKTTKTPYYLYEGTCTGWYAGESSESTQSYGGEEVELSLDEDENITDSENSGIYGYEIVLSIVIE